MEPDRDEQKIQEKMKRLLGKPPEYKLSDAKRRELIARLYKVSEERKRQVWYFPIEKVKAFAPAAVALAMFVFAFHFLFAPQQPFVTDVKGTVKVCRGSGNQWAFVDRRVTLRENDTLKTFGDGRADVVAPKRYHLRLDNDSEVKVAHLPSRASSGGIQYELSKGKVFAYYDNEHSFGRTFSINTNEAAVSALGTDFMVASMPALNKTWVGVLDGIVRVAGIEVPGAAQIKGASVLVEPGEKTIVRAGSRPTQPQRLMENELLEMEELYRIGTKPQVALLISTGAMRTRELLSVTPLYISTEKTGVLPDRIEKIAKQFSQAIKMGQKEKSIDNIRQFETLVNEYPNPKYDVQFLLFIGAYYEYLDEHNKAIETFRRVVDNYPKSNLASIAECAIGIIYEEKLRDPANAKKEFQKIISKYPRSPEVEEASSALNRIPS